jgi:LPS-assembly protein
VTNKLDTTIRNGFYTAREMSFGVGMTTRVFGMFGFGKNSKVQAIRHEIRPSISANYRPDMNRKNFYSTQTDAQGTKGRFNFYERSIFGSFNEGRFGGLSFGLDNIVQMKVKNAKDTGDASTKKISLIDGLSINGSYNFLADSFRFSPLTLAARTNLFDKINITANAQFDPYQTNAQGRRINELVWMKKPLSLGNLTGGGISLQSRFSGGNPKQQTNNNANTNRNNRNPNGMPMDEYQQEAAYMSNNPGEFADFSIPWDLNFAYSLRFARIPDFANPGKFINNFNQDINFNGSLNLSPKWKVGMTGSYNVTQKQLGVLTLNMSRDLHCWQMSIVVSPVGRYKFFTINISPKSNMLRDIKVNRTRYFFDL